MSPKGYQQTDKVKLSSANASKGLPRKKKKTCSYLGLVLAVALGVNTARKQEVMGSTKFCCNLEDKKHAFIPDFDF